MQREVEYGRRCHDSREDEQCKQAMCLTYSILIVTHLFTEFWCGHLPGEGVFRAGAAICRLAAGCACMHNRCALAQIMTTLSLWQNMGNGVSCLIVASINDFNSLHFCFNDCSQVLNVGCIVWLALRSVCNCDSGFLL